MDCRIMNQYENGVDVSAQQTQQQQQQQQQQQFSSANIAIRAQKKILSKVISRNNAKLFVNDAAIRLFDHLFQILKTEYNKVTAEKVVKNIIKLVVKLGIVSRSEQFPVQQQNQLAQIQRQMRQLCLTVISFGKVAFSYDRAYLNVLLKETHRRLQPLVEQNLSEKSKQRLDMIFEHVCQESVLDSLFRADGEHYILLPKVMNDLEILIDKKEL